MNKKDLINSFESLTPSDSQKIKMLNNVLESKKPKESYKVSFNFRHTFSTLAAAACVVAVIITVKPWYNSGHSLPQDTETAVKTEKTITDSEFKKVPDDTVDAQATDRADIASSGKTSTEKDTVPVQHKNEDAPAAALTEDAYEPDLSDEYPVADELPANYSRGIMSVAECDQVTPAYDGGYEQLTLDEYYEYIGVNVENTLDIPEGYSNTTNRDVMINMETDDSWQFTYEKGNSYISVSTTKDTESVMNKANNAGGSSASGGSKSAVEQDGQVSSTYIVSNGVGYTINTYQVSDADLSDLLTSIEE